ncbi:carboxymuconolactone decarboxylase family protein [Bailinhaonella thermotolerans]|uniref:Carboxymuconolactone decarboxylase family protein n=1 Tax=Bailinhaonella thermotolerans TaxID=1070861 RepID=A0A3A4ACC2_9ACTN|nr:carboxymuconolactone decarboxylase family protein [Bailinhaonella thermotolerans]RJL24437.1 carboxymuconolactone decarboxylase family protein [Bailinhaonella thermotolerans]
MSVFTTHTVETAPAEARAGLDAIARKQGFLPEAAARMAESPQALKAFLTGLSIFAQSGLEPVEREVVTFAVATRTRCHVCVAMHTGVLTGAGADPELIAALRAGRPLPDARLEALRIFTHAVMDHHGGVPDEDLKAFLDAGYTTRDSLDVVLGVGVYTLSTYANRLTGAAVDPALSRFAWDG